MMLEALIAANLAVSVIGGAVLVKWLVRHIRALEGTVKAQGETLATVTGLNNTFVNVFKAVDPDRWAKEVTVHKELADRKAAALVEEAERKFREERTALSSQTLEGVERMADLYGEAMSLALRFMPWVPKGHRPALIAGTKLTDHVKTGLTEMAESELVPDWSAGGFRGLGALLASTTGTTEGRVGTTLLTGATAETKDQAAETPLYRLAKDLTEERPTRREEEK